MAYNNYVITRPVVNDTNGGDIQRALGTTSGDLATLCTHPNINMWAKYKPTPRNLALPLCASTATIKSRKLSRRES